MTASPHVSSHTTFVQASLLAALYSLSEMEKKGGHHPPNLILKLRVTIYIKVKNHQASV